MLREKLLSRVMRTGGSKRGSVYNVNMNCEQAAGSRDALSKALYTRMFDWIVQAVNSALARLTANLRPEMILSLGVLDIFGFEVPARLYRYSKKMGLSSFVLITSMSACSKSSSN